MVQAWHTLRKKLAPLQEAEASYWRATEYRFKRYSDYAPNIVQDGSAEIEAAPGAVWKRSKPFESYRPTSRAREVGTGPHLLFLRLKGVLQERPHIFEEAMLLFANEYGLLGAFEERYLPQPVLPRQKFFVAPEAVIDNNGRLRRVAPSTEGKELLFRLKERQHDPWFVKLTELAALEEVRKEFKNLETLESELKAFKQHLIAMPSEIRFVPKVADWSWLDEESNGQLVPWEVIKEDFGALLILDNRSRSGVSVLCTRERVFHWLGHLDHFPSSNDMSAENLADYLSSVLGDVSPRAFVDEDGNLRRGWRCNSLLEAMRVMLFLDLTGGNTIKKCRSRGCPNYFRVGPQSKSKYCSERCANRASTRKGRGQEP